ncbi:hypothetical protein BARD7_02382 [Bacillus amyloliquefaciens]|nr:hypothetical protein BARD7_02382 [Bacillus amyloliquefaciens]
MSLSFYTDRIGLLVRLASELFRHAYLLPISGQEAGIYVHGFFRV